MSRERGGDGGNGLLDGSQSGDDAVVAGLLVPVLAVASAEEDGPNPRKRHKSVTTEPAAVISLDDDDDDDEEEGAIFNFQGDMRRGKDEQRVGLASSGANRYQTNRARTAGGVRYHQPATATSSSASSRRGSRSRAALSADSDDEVDTFSLHDAHDTSDDEGDASDPILSVGWDSQAPVSSQRGKDSSHHNSQPHTFAAKSGRTAQDRQVTSLANSGDSVIVLDDDDDDDDDDINHNRGIAGSQGLLLSPVDGVLGTSRAHPGVLRSGISPRHASSKRRLSLSSPSSVHDESMVLPSTGVGGTLKPTLMRPSSSSTMTAPVQKAGSKDTHASTFASSSRNSSSFISDSFLLEMEAETLQQHVLSHGISSSLASSSSHAVTMNTPPPPRLRRVASAPATSPSCASKHSGMQKKRRASTKSSTASTIAPSVASSTRHRDMHAAQVPSISTSRSHSLPRFSVSSLDARSELTSAEVRALDKEQRKRNREVAKRQKEHDKRVAKLKRSVSKTKDIKEHLCSMTMLVDPDILKKKAYATLHDKLRQHGVSIVEGRYKDVPLSVWWKRSITTVDEAKGEEVYSSRYEPFIVILLHARELVERIADGSGMGPFVKSIRDKVHSSCQITFVVEGLESYFKARAARSDREFRKCVASAGKGVSTTTSASTMRAAPRQTRADKIDKIMVEHVLVYLQLQENIHLCVPKTAADTMNTLFRITKAVAVSVDRKLGAVASFFQPEIKKSVKVNSKTFAGLKDLWVKQLMCVQSVSLEYATVIAERFPKPRLLLDALSSQGLSAVANITPAGRHRRIGEVIASRLLTFFTATDPHAYLS